MRNMLSTAHLNNKEIENTLLRLFQRLYYLQKICDGGNFQNSKESVHIALLNLNRLCIIKRAKEVGRNYEST